MSRSAALLRSDPSDEIARLTAEVARLRTELRIERAARTIAEAASHEDALTGILNRRGFQRDLDRALSFTRRYETPVALLLLDLDRFKPINDEHGHAAGDRVLKAFAATISGQLRGSDSFGRLGGDEFGIVLWQVDAETARAKARSLEAAIDKATFPAGDNPVRLGVSIGSTILLATDDPDAVVERADRAMYARKVERRFDPVRR